MQRLESILLTQPPTLCCSPNHAVFNPRPHWRRWWREEFLTTTLWQALRSRFVPALPTAQLPGSLLGRIEAATASEQLSQALRLLSPLSI